mmetsp:Transcript_48230/g.153984  ORF Transcript_48230/g.153984 Transcript_48230/m.153984 type:complete len:235 (-) Transcript_48230:617-1321(-)
MTKAVAEAAGLSPHHISTPPAVRHARRPSAERECDEAPDDEHNRTSLPKAPRDCPVGLHANRGLLQCGDGEALPVAPDDELNHTRPPQTSWASSSPGSLMHVLPKTCRGGSTDTAPAGPNDGPARPGFQFSVACNQPKGASGLPPQTAKTATTQKAQSRTLKYYPPPMDNTDLNTVDVIDHGSEVLVIRREPSPPPRLLSSTWGLGIGRNSSRQQAQPQIMAALPEAGQLDASI